ncbi:hypothetical protein [Longirhabdus pacifica]|uniref:hypothetical protein n=1 Tax=Longirhabdus pacifica TaxID=2305227 RepID=UPI001008FD74|nr:hypothetical protein [Longirhabdus pacifica]
MEFIALNIVLTFFIISIVLFIINILTSVWAYRDSLRKGKSKEYAILILVATIFFPILGIIIYLIIRND